MRWSIAFVCSLALAGCVTPPEVKVASGETGAALKELQKSQKQFGAAYIRELESIQELIVASILSDTVNRRVAALVEQGFDGDVISLSESIADDRRQARVRIEMIRSKLPVDEPLDDVEAYEEFVQQTLQSTASTLRRTAGRVQDRRPSMAQRMLATAARYETATNSVIADEEINMLAHLAYVDSMKNTVRDGLKDLEGTIWLLQLMHRQVDQWSRTDVRVEGEQIAAFLNEIAAATPPGEEP